MILFLKEADAVFDKRNEVKATEAFVNAFESSHAISRLGLIQFRVIVFALGSRFSKSRQIEKAGIRTHRAMPPAPQKGTPPYSGFRAAVARFAPGRRGRPFGQPPFLAFLLMAANLAALLDLPPFLPISAR